MSEVGASSPKEVLDLFAEAWGRGDADAFSRLFAADATYATFLGDVLVGREAIRETHHDIFTKWQKGTQLIVKAIQTRQLANDVTVLLTIGGMGQGDPEFDKFQTFTLVKRDDRWLIAAFQNTEMSSRSRPTYAH